MQKHSLIRTLCASLLLIVIALGVTRYPLSPWPLISGLAAYAALLCYRPVCFLLLLPVVIPAWDLGLWTGWMMIGEADFFILTTVAVLLIREPPSLIDILPAGLPRIIILVFVAAWTIAAVTGLASPLGAPPSDNSFLRPDNALRLAKGPIEALLLLPFLRQRHRIHADAVSWFGHGMAAGIVAVSLIVIAERALFTSILDLSADYRVAGPFSSMRVGGGHIGAYIALALPFAIGLTALRPKFLALPLSLLTCLLGAYTLMVTFARTAYAAGLAAMTVAGASWLWASRQRSQRLTPIGLLPVPLMLGALVIAASYGGMRERFSETAQDFATRRANWKAGLAVRDPGILPALFGMGLGTYQRAMFMRSAVNRPSDIALGRDDQGAYVSMQIETPFFLGQKITPPPTGNLHLSLLVRSPGPATMLGILICDKVLLYSDNCRGGNITLETDDVWRAVKLAIPAAGLGSGIGWLRRPVELSLFGGPIGHRIDIRGVGLTDDTGAELLANGDFADRLDRWIFTDDSHVSWRMLNQYLMLWFETGYLGLAAYLALAGLAIAGGLAAAHNGNPTGAEVAGSLTGFLVSGLFDNLLEAPRLSTLFFLVTLCGLIQWDAGSAHRLRLPRPASESMTKKL